MIRDDIAVVVLKGAVKTGPVEEQDERPKGEERPGHPDRFTHAAARHGSPPSRRCWAPRRYGSNSGSGGSLASTSRSAARASSRLPRPTRTTARLYSASM